MKVCPNNSEHNQFLTSAHEVHDWVVDGEGNFIEDKGCIEVSHGPEKKNEWSCTECGAVAIEV